MLQQIDLHILAHIAEEVDALRDDEWVFSGQSFTDILWMGADGKMRTGMPETAQKDNIWAIGFCNTTSRDSFVALFLDHHGTGLPELKHNAAPQMFYRWHGPCWSRYPLPVKEVPVPIVKKFEFSRKKSRFSG